MIEELPLIDPADSEISRTHHKKRHFLHQFSTLLKVGIFVFLVVTLVVIAAMYRQFSTENRSKATVSGISSYRITSSIDEKQDQRYDVAVDASQALIGTEYSKFTSVVTLSAASGQVLGDTSPLVISQGTFEFTVSNPNTTINCFVGQGDCQYQTTVVAKNRTSKTLSSIVAYTSSPNSTLTYTNLNGQQTALTTSMVKVVQPGEEAFSTVVRMNASTSAPGVYYGYFYLDGRVCNTNVTPPDCIANGGTGLPITMRVVPQPIATPTPTPTSTPIVTATPAPTSTATPIPEVYRLIPSEDSIAFQAAPALGYGVNVKLYDAHTNQIINNQSNIEYDWTTDSPNVIRISDVLAICLDSVQAPCPKIHADLQGIIPGSGKVIIKARKNGQVVATATVTVQINSYVTVTPSPTPTGAVLGTYGDIQVSTLLSDVLQFDTPTISKTNAGQYSITVLARVKNVQAAGVQNRLQSGTPLFTITYGSSKTGKHIETAAFANQSIIGMIPALGSTEVELTKPVTTPTPLPTPGSCILQPFCLQGIVYQDKKVSKCAIAAVITNPPACSIGKNTSKGPYTCGKTYTLVDTRYNAFSSTEGNVNTVDYVAPQLGARIVGFEAMMNDGNGKYKVAAYANYASENFKIQTRSGCNTLPGGWFDVCSSSAASLSVSAIDATGAPVDIQKVNLNFVNQATTASKPVQVTEVRWKFIIPCVTPTPSPVPVTPSPTPMPTPTATPTSNQGDLTSSQWNSILSNPSMSLGSSSAPVTIVEFTDLQCPACRLFFQQTFLQLKANYIDTNKVRFLTHDFPLTMHANAHLAAQAARCAGDQGKYEQMYDALFTQQSAWASSSEPVQVFEQLGNQLGLNANTFVPCVMNHVHGSEVDRDIALGTSIGVPGTPMFYLNRKLISGAVPYSQFQIEIENVLHPAPTPQACATPPVCPSGTTLAVGDPRNGGCAAYQCIGPITPSPTPQPTASPNPFGSGLSAVFFDNKDFTKPKQTIIDAIDAAKITKNVAFSYDWQRNAPFSGMGADTFSIRWTGSFTPQVSGEYTFIVRADDGVRLWIGDKQIINYWKDTSARESKGTIPLQQGISYPIKMEYYENGGKATVSLAWSVKPSSTPNPTPVAIGPGFTMQGIGTVPASVKPNQRITLKFLVTEPNGKTGAAADGFNLQAYIDNSIQSLSADNGTYDGKYWVVTLTAPAQKGQYKMSAAAYCSRDISTCAQTYGRARQVEWSTSLTVE